MPPGTQTYPFRNEFAKDIPGTLKALEGIGTRRIELCSPWSYREFAGFKDYKPADLKKLLDANNIVAESCHYGMAEFKSNLDERIAWAKEVGMKQMILASMSGSHNLETAPEARSTFLSKPFTPRVLLETITGLLGNAPLNSV